MAAGKFMPADKVTCIVDRELGDRVEELLVSAGAQGLLVQPGRSAVLRGRGLALNPRKAERLEENPAEIFRFYVPPGQDRTALALLAREAGLEAPGRGSVFSERVQLCGLEPSPLHRDRLLPEPRLQTSLQSDLDYICCIVQRGEAAALARSVLQMGISVPVVTFGRGMGLRDKLGLLRITIPAEKDILHLVVPRQDSQEVFDFMADVARLHQPGRGFIYMVSLRHGLIDTRLYRGEVRHVASIEQVIAAIDTLKGDAGWRKKTALPRLKRERGYLRDLVNYTILGEESRVEELVHAALEAGAGGATVSSLRAAGLPAAEGAYVSHARQASDLIIPESMVRSLHPAVLARVESCDDPSAFIELSGVEKASTYRHR